MSDDCESPDGSIYNPLLGLWTDPDPGPSTRLLWWCRVEPGEGNEPTQRFWAEAMQP